MKAADGISLIAAMIRKTGVVTADVPSINHPIPVKFYYRKNHDGTLGWIWPASGHQLSSATILNMQTVRNRRFERLQRLFFAIGLAGLVSHGQLVLYADVPTATFLSTHPWLNSI
jgi:hypothetical protein